MGPGALAVGAGAHDSTIPLAEMLGFSPGTISPAHCAILVRKLRDAANKAIAAYACYKSSGRKPV